MANIIGWKQRMHQKPTGKASILIVTEEGTIYRFENATGVLWRVLSPKGDHGGAFAISGFLAGDSMLQPVIIPRPKTDVPSGQGRQLEEGVCGEAETA